MKTETSTSNLTQRLSITFGAVLAILSIPLITMQFTNEVNWDYRDFIIMGIFLSVTGLVIEFLTRKIKSFNLRVILTIGILLVLFLIWAELAVGIFGRHLQVANLQIAFS